MQKRLLPSPVALMWAEDKVRLEIGMPGAQWGKKERARGWKDENRRKGVGRRRGKIQQYRHFPSIEERRRYHLLPK